MKHPVILFALLGIAVGCSGGTDSGTTANADPAMPSNTNTAANTDTNTAGTGATVTFASLQPTIQEKCVGCHGDAKPAEGLSLTSYASLMKGGEHGPVVVPGDPDKSRLVHALRGMHGMTRMPAKADPLAEETIALVETWVREGAKE